jgi:hypothetical protein
LLSLQIRKKRPRPLLQKIGASQSSLLICDTYNSKFPHFCTISKLLSPTDHAFLIKMITTNCSTLWSLLKSPSTPVVRNIIIVFLSHLDTFLTQYLTSSLISNPLFQFYRPRATVNPSVIHQVSSTEITIDPYLKSLRDNYYFPISDMSVEMQIDSNSLSGTSPLSPALGGTATVLQNNRKITVEDSVEVISELIAEIQASEKVDIDLASSSNPPQSTVKTHPTSKASSTIRFSLAHQKRVGGTLPNNLSSLKKFFHVLLSTKAVSILSVRSDSKASPMNTTSAVNELHAISSKIFFKASKPNGSLAGDYHISSSLSYEEISSHEKIQNWLTLQGY